MPIELYLITLILFVEVTIIFLGHSQAYSLKSCVHLFFIFMHNSQIKYQMAVFYYTGLQSMGFFPCVKRSLSEQEQNSVMKQLITVNSTHYWPNPNPIHGNEKISRDLGYIRYETKGYAKSFTVFLQ